MDIFLCLCIPVYLPFFQHWDSFFVIESSSKILETRGKILETSGNSRKRFGGHCNVGSKFRSKSYFDMNSPSISRSAIRFRFLNPGTSFHANMDIFLCLCISYIDNATHQGFVECVSGIFFFVFNFGASHISTWIHLRREYRSFSAFLDPGTSLHEWHCNVGIKFRSKSYFDMNSPSIPFRHLKMKLFNSWSNLTFFQHWSEHCRPLQFSFRSQLTRK